MAGIEPSYTKFNLTYPAPPFNSTGTVFLNDTGPSSSSLDTYNISNIPSIVAGLLVPHAVCTLFLLARVWSRLLLLRKWFRDDTLILAAWLCSTAVCAAYAIAAQTPNLDNAVLRGGSSGSGGGGAYSLTTYLGLIFYQLALLLTKLSILSFYLRMFSSRPVERALALATVGVVVAYGVPLLAISILQCPPPSSSGDGFSSFPRPTTGKCFAFTPLLIASASLHTATDAWLIALVAPCVSRLAIPRGQKAALAAVLSLGVFVIAASLTRLQLSLRGDRKSVV